MICFCTTQTCSFPEAPTGSWSCNNSNPKNDFNWGQKRSDWRIGRIFHSPLEGLSGNARAFFIAGNLKSLWVMFKPEVWSRPKSWWNGQTVVHCLGSYCLAKNNLSPKFLLLSDFLQFIDFTLHNLLHCNVTASKGQPRFILTTIIIKIGESLSQLGISSKASQNIICRNSDSSDTLILSFKLLLAWLAQISMCESQICEVGSSTDHIKLLAHAVP